MESVPLLLLAVLILGFGVVSKRIRHSLLTAPIVFVAFGLAVGPSGLGLIHVDLNIAATSFIMELTLILVLFTDAAHIRFKSFWTEQQIALRMLGIGLFIQVALGTALGYWLFDYLGFWSAALLAAVLVPTDAALAQACLDNPRVPRGLTQSIEVESGINDGLALPLITFLVVCQSWNATESIVGFWAEYLIRQLLVGVALGAGLGYLGGQLVTWASTQGWMDVAYEKLSVVALALGSYSSAILLEGNGFVSVFVAGLVVGHSVPALGTRMREFAELEGSLLVLIALFIFGAVLLPLCYYVLTWQLILYVVLTLTLVRMAATAICTLGLGLHKDTVLFLGWMGPRGIATILFGLFVLEAHEVVDREAIFRIATAVAAVSVCAHGLTAHGVSSWYVRRLKGRNLEPRLKDTTDTHVA